MKNNFFVFDTNVLLSALFDDNGNPAKALRKARKNGTLLISDDIAAEYIQVFAREKFDKYLALSYRFAFIENIVSNSLPVIIRSPVIACRYPKDDKFLSAAVAGKSGCIISGDSDLLILHPFKGIPILNPSDFVNYFDIL